jgi:hypothetical protein
VVARGDGLARSATGSPRRRCRRPEPPVHVPRLNRVDRGVQWKRGELAGEQQHERDARGAARPRGEEPDHPVRAGAREHGQGQQGQYREP